MSAQTGATFLVVNDFLSKIKPFRTFVTGEGEGDVGGVARLARAISKVRGERPGECLALVAGLDFCGPLAEFFGGEAEGRCLARAGFDAAAPGIHEFAYGPETTGAMLSSMPFPVLCANLAPRHPALQGAFVPHVVFQTARAKVGVLGLDMLPPAALMIEGPSLERLDDVQCARRSVETLSKCGCTVIVALTHVGTQADIFLAGKVSGIHAIFGGHSHRCTHEPEIVEAADGWRTLVLQAGTGGSLLGRLDLVLDTLGRTDMEATSWTLMPMNDQAEEDSETAALAGRYADAVAERLQDPVATLPARITARRDELRKGQSPAGNLLADALRWCANADIGLACAGHLGDCSLGPGAVRLGDVARLAPFDFAIFEYHMPGKVLLEALALSGKALQAVETQGFVLEAFVPDSFLQVSGVRVNYSKEGALLRALPVGKGGPAEIVPEAIYSVAAPWDLASGAFGYSMFKDTPGGNIRHHGVETVAAWLATNPDPEELFAPRAVISA